MKFEKYVETSKKLESQKDIENFWYCVQKNYPEEIQNNRKIKEKYSTEDIRLKYFVTTVSEYEMKMLAYFEEKISDEWCDAAKIVEYALLHFGRYFSKYILNSMLKFYTLN